MAIKYSEKVIQHFTSPQNVGDLLDANAVATEGSPACGDMVTFSLKINSDTHVVEDVRFRSFGCASNIATASMATLLAKGHTIEEIKALSHKNLTDALGGLPAIKLHCSILAVDGLKAAVHHWEVEHGLAHDSYAILDMASVSAALNAVVNPRNGKSLLEAEMLGKVEIDAAAGQIYQEIRISEADERFAENIESEVREKLGSLPGVHKIIVRFTIKS